MNLMLGDCLVELIKLDDDSVDSIVTDPPYGLSFMGKKWDYDVPLVEVWKECLRVLKPGGHLLSFGGSRTYHRMACAVEDAGFEIRDQIMWVYGSGFPKSLNIGKSINAEIKTGGSSPRNLRQDRLGDEYKPTGQKDYQKGRMFSSDIENDCKDVSLCKEAKQWQGWGTGLKPAHEPIVLARKPISEKNITQNVLKHGTGGINIDECRIGSEIIKINRHKGQSNSLVESTKGKWDGQNEISNKGRFPSNFIHDGSDEVMEGFPEMKNSFRNSRRKGTGNPFNNPPDKTKSCIISGFNDSGSAARFFYCAKASQSEKNDGLNEFEERIIKSNMNSCNGTKERFDGKESPKGKNTHTTVKPIKLMGYLIKLITPPRGTVLDPFMGSGSTGCAANKLGFNFIGIEREPEYFNIAQARIDNAGKNIQTDLEDYCGQT